jgi:hypothetical protein
MMIGPINQASRQAKVGVGRGKMLSQETRGPRICKLERQPAVYGTCRHPNRLTPREGEQVAGRSSDARFGYSKDREPGRVQARPSLAQPVPCGPAAADAYQAAFYSPDRSHQRRCRHSKTLPQVTSAENAASQLVQYSVHDETILARHKLAK